MSKESLIVFDLLLNIFYTCKTVKLYRSVIECLKSKFVLKPQPQASNEELQAALLEDKSSLILETEMSIKQECLARLEPGETNRELDRFIKIS